MALNQMMLTPITAKLINLFFGLIIGIYLPTAILYLIFALRKRKGAFSAVWIGLSRIVVLAIIGLLFMGMFGLYGIYIEEKILLEARNTTAIWLGFGAIGGFLLGLIGLIIGIIRGKQQKAA